MTDQKALLLSVSTGLFIDFGVPPGEKFQATHGFLPLDNSTVQHYVNLMNSVAELVLPELEEVIFSDSRFRLLKTPFETVNDMTRIFGGAEAILGSTAFGHSLAVTIIPAPSVELLEAHALPLGSARLNLPAEGGMYFSGEVGSGRTTWESFGLDFDDLHSCL